jgi:hypothetical protein
MFLRSTIRRKDGKEHRYWSVVETRRVAGRRVVQRPLLYLGEINSSQELAWREARSWTSSARTRRWRTFTPSIAATTGETFRSPTPVPSAAVSLRA